MCLVSIKQNEHLPTSTFFVFSMKGLIFVLNFCESVILFCSSHASTSSVRHNAHVGRSIKELHFGQTFFMIAMSNECYF
jgi:hypothetical protein